MKYDKMVEITKGLSQKKIDLAQKAISDMLRHGEKITVAKLVRKTGLSRGFFYKNATIRPQLDAAIYKQQSMDCTQETCQPDEKEEPIVISLKREVLKERETNAELAKQNSRYAKENAALRQKVEKLEKQLGKKEISFLKKL